MFPYTEQVDVLTHILSLFPKNVDSDHWGIKFKLQEDLDIFPKLIGKSSMFEDGAIYLA